MKLFVWSFFFLILSLNVLASTIQGQISSIDIGLQDEPHLIKLSDGQVAFIEYGEKNLLKKIEKSFEQKDWLELTLGTRNSLKSIQVIPPQFSYDTRNQYPDLNEPGDPYIPTVVTLTKAKNIFIKMRKNYQTKSQCFNRAHIWTYEEFMRSATNMNKVFLFFTSKYIRTYRFNWWFHVTPMMYVGGTKFSNWKMLDRRYTTTPLSPKTWTDIFIKSKRSCKVVSKYSAYHENQRSQDCYMIPVSMYYVVPSDIARLEETGEQRTAYEEVEIEHALWEAF